MESTDELKNFMKWLNDNQWLNIIFLIMALLSIAISTYAYIKGKKKKKPVYSKRSINVFSDALESLGNIEVTYLGNQVNNLTITKVAFWNSGNDTLNTSDQAIVDKLRIEVKSGIQLFKAQTIFESNPSNNLKTNIHSNIVEITFDFFDQNEGGIIKIIHSGKNSNDLILKGTFKGSGPIKEINVFTNDSNDSHEARLARMVSSKAILTIEIVFFWAGLIILLFGFSLLFKSISVVTIPALYAYLPYALIAVGFFSLLLFTRTKKLPKQFNSFFEDE